VLDAEQDYFRHDVIQIGGTERAGKTHRSGLTLVSINKGKKKERAWLTPTPRTRVEGVGPQLAERNTK
jgi:hypothetical protein